MPASDYTYLDHSFVAMAHRGGWLTPADAPRENTAYAFRRAVELGYGYLETDVHTTADGVLLAFHDDVLDRVTDATGPLKAWSWADLDGVRIAGIDPIPRFADLLEEFPHTRFNIDLKDAGSVQPLVDALKRLHAEQRVCVGSFSGARLRAFRRLLPDVLTSTTPRAVVWATHAFGLRRLFVDAGAALQIPQRDPGAPLALVRPDVVRLSHKTGRVVHVWTVNDEAEMHRLIDLGIDGLVSDDITTLKRVLLERGLWEGER
ncbi:MAG TPA: glycerophosphodiester phosphodiesterase family protein [Propionicimonas sp.]|uniref:glycerophosphodiester phosphodiesterase family protein n=1 Tax=Propionicimonas sp. TaxID=1955623 RepID=UPI002F40A0E5